MVDLESMVGPSRKEFDALKQAFEGLNRRVKTLEGSAGTTGSTGSTGSTGTTGGPKDSATAPPQVSTTEGVQLQPPVVKVDGARYTIEASLTATKDVTLGFLQLAVRGDGAQDLAHQRDVSLSAGQVTKLRASAVGTGGDYTAWVAYSVDGAKTWVDGPKTAFPIDKQVAAVETGQNLKPDAATTQPSQPDQPSPTTPETGGVQIGRRRIPLIGRSGLPFNSLVFRQQVDGADAFERWRGNPVDGLMWFTTRGNWGHFRGSWGSKADYLASKRLVVTTLPHAPTDEGDAMNQRGANDAYRDQQRDFGRFLVEAGLNSPYHVLRVDWEANGNWYNWSANRPGGAEALKAAIRNFVVNVRGGGATQVKFDLCWNKGPSHSGADYGFFPGAEFIDVVTIDSYDFWTPSFNDNDWRQNINKQPGLANLVDFAKRNGIQWGIDECGNTHGEQSSGGDNPYYFQKLWDFCNENAASCAWMVTYDDPGAPASLAHHFEANPRTADLYRKLWGRRG